MQLCFPVPNTQRNYSNSLKCWIKRSYTDVKYVVNKNRINYVFMLECYEQFHLLEIQCLNCEKLNVTVASAV